jgi:hypothetical protein
MFKRLSIKLAILIIHGRVWMIMKEMLRFTLDKPINKYLASYVGRVIYRTSYHHSSL